MPPTPQPRMRRLKKYMAKDFFSYVITQAAALAPAAQATGNVVLDADSDFLWQKLTAYVDVAGAGQTADTAIVPGVTIVVTDTASGRALSNAGVPLPAFSGTGELPFILPTPKIFKASGQITVSFQNITAATTYSSIRLVFHGQKMFLGGG